MNGDRILSLFWFGHALLLVGSLLFREIPNFWGVMETIGAAAGFVALGLHNERIANDR